MEGNMVFLESHALERERKRALRPHQVKQAAQPFQNISGTVWNVLLGVCPDLPLDCVTDTRYSYRETHALVRKAQAHY